MHRYAVFVDAGFLTAGAASLLTGSPKRNRLSLDFEAMRIALEKLGTDLATPSTMLRIYWYDAATDAKPTSWHDSLSDQPSVKVRLGHLRGNPPRQKGVDTLLVRDLIVLAEQRAIADAVLIAGDEDIREGVVYVQERGIRVHLVVMEGAGSSRTLRQEADSVFCLDRDIVSTFATIRAEEEKRDVA